MNKTEKNKPKTALLREESFALRMFCMATCQVGVVCLAIAATRGLVRMSFDLKTGGFLLVGIMAFMILAALDYPSKVCAAIGARLRGQSDDIEVDQAIDTLALDANVPVRFAEDVLVILGFTYAIWEGAISPSHAFNEIFVEDRAGSSRPMLEDNLNHTIEILDPSLKSEILNVLRREDLTVSILTSELYALSVAKKIRLNPDMCL